MLLIVEHAPNLPAVFSDGGRPILVEDGHVIAAVLWIGLGNDELILPDGDGFGVLLGGGAETAVLDVISDLRVLAEILGGQFVPRLPETVDYAI